MGLGRRLQLGAMRCFARTLGRASDGVRIAFDSGFTSGVMLDYVYENRPRGRFLIGRWFDRYYLSHPGWEAIRIRKANLERLLESAVSTLRGEGARPVLLDVASGPGQYMLDVLSRPGMDDIEATCRDLDESGLALGRRNAEERGIANVRFVAGDALDRDSLNAVEPRPNIVISSGFYDWITDDDLVRKSMSLIHEVLPENGFFLFTNQAGHVDLEMVQAVFIDFRGDPLRMVTRPPPRR